MPAFELQMRRARTTAKGGPVLSAPKTRGSRRSVKLPPTASDALRGHLERQLAEIDKVGSLWQENGLIFASEVGEPLDRRYVTTHRFKPPLNRAGPPRVRFHDLRHTCATLLLSKNVNPKVVSEMLSHATIAITPDTYSHVLPDNTGWRRQSDGRGAFVAYCCPTAAKGPGSMARGFVLPDRVLRDLQVIRQYRRSGSNRHSPFGEPDFESGASTNSATQFVPFGSSPGLRLRRVGTEKTPYVSPSKAPFQDLVTRNIVQPFRPLK